jgi:DNA invertase Pin-like site-specific DNA recombinase
MTMHRYFIYCRKSTEEERQFLSIEAQLTELREYAEREGLFVLKEFTESQSAKEPGRWRTLKIKGAFSQRLGRMGSLNMSQSSMPFFDQ